MTAFERRKGARYELEVAGVLREFELAVDRTVHNSGMFLRGDLTGVDGYHFECKRQETLRVPAWIRQAQDDCGDCVPVVVFRQSRGESWATLPLRDLARLLALAELRA